MLRGVDWSIDGEAVAGTPTPEDRFEWASFVEHHWDFEAKQHRKLKLFTTSDTDIHTMRLRKKSRQGHSCTWTVFAPEIRNPVRAQQKTEMLNGSTPWIRSWTVNSMDRPPRMRLPHFTRIPQHYLRYGMVMDFSSITHSSKNFIRDAKF